MVVQWRRVTWCVGDDVGVARNDVNMADDGDMFANDVNADTDDNDDDDDEDVVGNDNNVPHPPPAAGPGLVHAGAPPAGIGGFPGFFGGGHGIGGVPGAHVQPHMLGTLLLASYFEWPEYSLTWRGGREGGRHLQ